MKRTTCLLPLSTGVLRSTSIGLLALALAGCLGGGSGEGTGAGPGAGNSTADPGVRRCGDFLTSAQAEAIGIHDGGSSYNEDSEEDNPGLGLLCRPSEGTFTVFVGAQYPTILAGAGDNAVEDDRYGQRSFSYELFGTTTVGVLTDDGAYAFVVGSSGGDDLLDPLVSALLTNAAAL